MEEINEKKQTKYYVFLIRYLPYIIAIFVITMIGLSFIGHFFVVQYYKNDVLVSNKESFATLLFTQHAGINVEIYLLTNYLVLPIIACVLLIFSSKHHYLKLASMFIFLLIAICSIVVKDTYSEAIYQYYKIVDGVKYQIEIVDVSFVYYLPVITYFVSFGTCFYLSFSDVEFSVRDITEMGVVIAIAIALNFVKILPMPTGGSINIQMVPLFFLALRRGPLKGFICSGIVYGLITCLIDGYGFATFPFDYLLGFGSVTIIGFFSPYILRVGEKNYTLKGELLLLLAGTLATTMRFIAGTVSSMLVYGYDLLPAMAYNSMYVYISGALSIAVLMALLGPICRINTRYPVESNSR